jgi:DNA helicase-2/ATP-dependent DNA helicase PcrA
LEAYLERTWLVNETDDWDAQTDKATLMTMHAAKGLEFPVVFIVAVEEGVLPHERVGRHPDELEEERRLAFVGITRAKEELQLSYAVMRDYRGQRRHTVPSSFLMEMPRGEMELRDDAGQFINLVYENVDESFQDSHRVSERRDHWDGDDDTVEWDVVDVSVESADARSAPAFDVAAAAITTAAALEQETEDNRSGATAGLSSSASQSARAREKAVPAISPDVFKLGMAVMHPEYGPGKIAALSGSGKNRRATVRFVTAGEKKFILAHSTLRPRR